MKKSLQRNTQCHNNRIITIIMQETQWSPSRRMQPQNNNFGLVHIHTSFDPYLYTHAFHP